MAPAEFEAQRERFLKVLSASGMTKAGLSRISGVPKTTIYSYCSRQTDRLMSDTQRRLAVALDTTVEALFIGPRADASVAVLGAFGGRGEVQKLTAPIFQIELPPGVTPGDYVAYEVGALHMPPAEPGWVAIFRADAVRPADALNTLGLVETANGRTYFRRLRKGYAAGRYNLEGWDGSPPMEDVQVTGVRPLVSLAAQVGRLPS